jgi:hypothetical protein
MASLTAFFKPVPAPNATPKKAAAAATPASSAAAASSASPASSPKPTAASRKRKSVETESKEGDPADQMADEGEQPAAVEVDDVAAKKMKVAGLEDLIPKDWAAVLKPEFSKSYWPAINKFLKGQEHVKIFPQRSHIFRALELCPFDNVNVVILGQDPVGRCNCPLVVACAG